MDLVELLEQDRLWVERGGKVTRIAHMTPEHCRNTAAMLRRRAKAIMRNYDALTLVNGSRVHDYDSGGALLDKTFYHDDPVSRLNEMPLLKALHRRSIDHRLVPAHVRKFFKRSA